jgi:intein/homing endonuclease
MDAEAGKVCAANSKDHSQDSPEWLMRETPLEKSVHRKVQRTEHREFLKQFHHGLLEVIEGRTLPRQSRISSAQSKTPSSKQPKRYRGRSGGGRRRGKKMDAVEAEEDVIGNRTNIGKRSTNGQL